MRSAGTTPERPSLQEEDPIPCRKADAWITLDLEIRLAAHGACHHVPHRVVLGFLFGDLTGRQESRDQRMVARELGELALPEEIDATVAYV